MRNCLAWLHNICSCLYKTFFSSKLRLFSNHLDSKDLTLTQVYHTSTSTFPITLKRNPHIPFTTCKSPLSPHSNQQSANTDEQPPTQQWRTPIITQQLQHPITSVMVLSAATAIMVGKPLADLTPSLQSIQPSSIRLLITCHVRYSPSSHRFLPILCVPCVGGRRLDPYLQLRTSPLQ